MLMGDDGRTQDMDIDRVGIHESTNIDFPFGVIAEELSDIDAELNPVVDNVEALSSCDAVVTFTHRDEILTAAPDWVHTSQAGVDGFPLEEYAARDIVLTSSSGLHGESVSETTLGMMLSLARRLHIFRDRQREHVWQFPEWDQAFTLGNERVTVVGLGTIGQGLARRATGVGMEVVGVRRTPKPVDGVKKVYSRGDLHQAIEGTRFLVLAVPLTEETCHLIGPEELTLLGEEGYLVNVARGAVVDQDALVAALEAGTIAGAALDVVRDEPLADDSPLWDFDDVLVTPHAAVANRSFYRDIGELIRKNYQALARGDEPQNRVA